MKNVYVIVSHVHGEESEVVRAYESLEDARNSLSEWEEDPYGQTRQDIREIELIPTKKSKKSKNKSSENHVHEHVDVDSRTIEYYECSDASCSSKEDINNGIIKSKTWRRNHAE